MMKLTVSNFSHCCFNYPFIAKVFFIEIVENVAKGSYLICEQCGCLLLKSIFLPANID